MSSRSTISRLRKNLANTNRKSNRKPRQRRFSTNKSNLRKNLLLQRTRKYSPKRTVFNNNTPMTNKMHKVLYSHRNNRNNFAREQIETAQREREEALESINDPAYLHILGSVFEVEAPPRTKERRRKRVEKYYPEPVLQTHNEAKTYGPKGQKKAIQKIRMGKNKCLNCGKAMTSRNNLVVDPVSRNFVHKHHPEQRYYDGIGLPYNINNTYYRKRVPDMVKISHKKHNAKINTETAPYTRFKPPKSYKVGRFTVSSQKYNNNHDNNNHNQNHSHTQSHTQSHTLEPKRVGRFTVLPLSQ